MISNSISAAMIIGHVFLNTADINQTKTIGVPNVEVTDGYTVSLTDKEGRYALSPHKNAEFIYITRPSGYDIVGNWYYPVSTNADFKLKPSNVKEDVFSFIHLTDPHISDNSNCLAGLEKFVEEINRYNPRPLFVVNSGDLINMDKAMEYPAELGRTYFKNYTERMNRLTIPHYDLAGDHSDVGYKLEKFPPGNEWCGKAMYFEFLGPSCFSFEYGKIHFVVMDIFYRQEKGKSVLKISPERLQWLKQDLRFRSSGTVVVTVSHCPLNGYIPGFPSFVRSNSIIMQLVGDAHIVSQYEQDSLIWIGGALCGLWWQNEDNICPDLSPSGYSIFTVEEKKLSPLYKGLGRQAGVNLAPFSVISGATSIQGRLFQGSQPGPLEYCIDNNKWRPAGEITESGSPYCRQYEIPIDSKTIPDGIIELKVRPKNGHELCAVQLIVDNQTAPQLSITNAVLKFEIGGVIAADILPAGPVDVLFNNQVIGNISSKATRYSFEVPAGLMKKVNKLTFNCGDSENHFTVRNIALTCGNRTYFDPKQQAIRDACAKCWLKSEINYIGASVGGNMENMPPHSLALPQNSFYFILTGK